ncbi:iron(III) transport system ATP-binding protein [Arthrobacter stackebrandtii]|uniref:Iron(III) transport system ATP-binding protein n=1 Tax=Arthrobacter stackebrandtii TaxID=272161 RepID=A0ABS4YSJ7_9MICC|nr:ABC transporter ATP-binding protein [Arthrobacter stackebrandtii]MBP2411772.1 iron(III) transport system ATP-binding protein [Arthrobacter stackebrandtii]PYG99164.1 ABC transporter ATP-binding protein [Arthrobacter stackebrandtii]
MPEVKVSGLHKKFGDTTVLNDINFTIREGEFFTLLGPSGCGKSTTLNSIAGLESPTSGSITVGGTPFVDTEKKVYVPTEERNLGMVFQSYALWPHMTVEANLVMPLAIRKVSREEKESRIHEALDTVGLAHLKDRFPHQLSGGQQQRVALARALVYSPSVLLLDEPLSNLDAKLREQSRAWLKRLQVELGITTVYVTHDQDEALSLSDRIAVMFEGKMAQIGTPAEIYEKPATAAVAAFVGSCNFFTGILEHTAGGTAHVRLDNTGLVVKVASTLELFPGDAVTVAVRPERLTITPATADTSGANVLETTVLTRSYVGSRYEYGLKLGSNVVQVISPVGNLDGGVRLVFEADDALLYAGADVPSAEAQELMTVSA